MSTTEIIGMVDITLCKRRDDDIEALASKAFTNSLEYWQYQLGHYRWTLFFQHLTLE